MMKLCSECGHNPWPYIFIVLIAGVSTFLTWLMLSFVQTDYWLQIAASIGMFGAVSFLLLHYVRSCLRRHCRHA